MRIYILPVPKKLQPATQKIEYPSGNPDFGVEQDFLDYIQNSASRVDTPEDADWHYLPVFWTRWHLNHDYGRTGISELQNAVSSKIIDSRKTFTICQYDDGPIVKLGSTKLFLASRKSAQGIDIPLLRNKHKVPVLKPRRKYLASFVGRLSTHPIRKKMAKALEGVEGVKIFDGDNGQEFFVKSTLCSYVALCPRGYGGSSFRLFEAMQLGTVPLLVGSPDTRPFKRFISWDDLSIYVEKPEDVADVLTSYNIRDLKRMGKKASRFYDEHLQYGKWCNYVFKELGEMK